jgi:DNA-binding response OmpR family regulator
MPYMTDSIGNINVLFVEDDETIAFLVKDNLEIKGYKVFHAFNGAKAMDLFKNNLCDICILDIMLPDIDGFEIAAGIRKSNPAIPILFLTARSLVEDKIKGFNIGADDYIVKPFSIHELLLRMDVFLKRKQISNQTNSNEYLIGDILFDYINLELRHNNSQKSLTQREADLLKLLFINSNRIVKRDEILKTLWGDDDYFLGRSLDVFISRLRKLLNTDPKTGIENVHGVGFRLKI